MTMSAKISKYTGLLLLIGGVGSIRMAYGQMTHEPGHQEGHHNDLGSDSGHDWLTPWPHSHFSERGTPFVHPFNIEPAFLGRELFLSYGSVRGSEGDEAELEMELEWAFTRRIGMIVEAPLIQLDPTAQTQNLALAILRLRLERYSWNRRISLWPVTWNCPSQLAMRTSA